MNKSTRMAGYCCALLLVFLLHNTVSFLPNTNSILCRQRRTRWFDDAVTTDDTINIARRPVVLSPAASSLDAYSLNTAFEWLWEERSHQESYNGIEWIDIMDQKPLPYDDDDDDDHDGDCNIVSAMPLYPLGETYLPIGTHMLNNVEPRNIQMALDLLALSSSTAEFNNDSINGANDDGSVIVVATNTTIVPPRFCTVLCASDTGKVASVGTIMRIVKAEKQYSHIDGRRKIARIKLTCEAEALASICEVENPTAFSRENRLRRSPEYLKARVRLLENEFGKGVREMNASSNEGSCEQQQRQQIDLYQQALSTAANYFHTIKTMYQLEIGGDKLPPGALSTLGNAMKNWTMSAKKDTNLDALADLFWKLSQEWQSVCYTVRQGKQAMLSTDRNELMVDAALKQGGPLKLPIHMEDLPPSVQREIQLMEVESQQDYCRLGLDPCLDFQALISIPHPIKRIEWLSFMISRERQRLEDIISVGGSSTKKNPTSNRWRSRLDDDSARKGRKGAWFQD